MTPSAESSTYCPFCQSSQIMIDTTSVPKILPGDSSTVANAAALQAKLLAGNKLQDCLARKYFRFTFGKLEDPARDVCTIQTLSDGLSQGMPLGQVLLRLASTPAFKQRRFN